METLLDQVIITVKDLDRSIAFYDTALKPLGIVHAIDLLFLGKQECK
jgi:catechol 2,3-dioxygenase-like lactoylglutathione lyase family enzyme